MYVRHLFNHEGWLAMGQYYNENLIPVLTSSIMCGVLLGAGSTSHQRCEGHKAQNHNALNGDLYLGNWWEDLRAGARKQVQVSGVGKFRLLGQSSLRFSIRSWGEVQNVVQTWFGACNCPFFNILKTVIYTHQFFTHYFMKATNTLRFLKQPNLTILWFLKYLKIK
jgi:hypothetical protein